MLRKQFQWVEQRKSEIFGKILMQKGQSMKNNGSVIKSSAIDFLLKSIYDYYPYRLIQYFPSMYTSFTISPQIVKEMLQVHRLYAHILEAYRTRLLEQVQNNKLADMDEQQVSKYIEAIKYFLNNHEAVYNDTVCKRQSGVNQRKIKEDMLKQEAAEHKVQINFHEIAIKLQQSKVKKEKEEYKFDYTSMMPQAKISYKYEPFLKKEEPKFEEASLSSCEQDSIDDQYMEKAEMQTTYLIFGMFSRQNIKRHVKKAKISLYFDDLFIKCYKNGRDAYFQRAIIQLNHIEKEAAPIA